MSCRNINIWASIIPEITKELHQEGIIKSFYNIFRLILFKICYINFFIILDINIDNFVSSHTLPKNISFQVVTYDNKNILDNSFGPITLSIFHERLKKGNLCIVCVLDDIIICYGWISFSGIGLVSVEDGEVYLFGSYVLSRYRRKGMHLGILHERMKILKNKGLKTAVIAVALFNPRLWNMLVSKFNFRTKGIMFYVKLFGKDIRIFKKLL